MMSGSQEQVVQKRPDVFQGIRSTELKENHSIVSQRVEFTGKPNQVLSGCTAARQCRREAWVSAGNDIFVALALTRALNTVIPKWAKGNSRVSDRPAGRRKPLLAGARSDNRREHLAPRDRGPHLDRWVRLSVPSLKRARIAGPPRSVRRPYKQ
jgi:hypothetical protein